MITTDQSVVPSISFEAEVLSKIFSALDDIKAEEYSKMLNDRKGINPLIFTEEEQSILWRCMNDKICPELCYNLSKIVDEHCEEYKFDLFRGISNSLLKRLYNKGVGDTFILPRVTSFSEDYAIARSFASYDVYGTKTILHVVGPVIAFPYSRYMEQILLAAPDCEFSGIDKNKHRMDNVDMVQNEQEWMIQEFTKMRILEINDDELTGMCTVKVEII